MNHKYNNLIKYLKELGSVAVAFSGGVDSTLLLKAAKEALGDKAISITVVSPYIPKWEIEEAKELANNIGIKSYFLEVPMLEEIRFNPEDRCYICKKGVFTKIKELAKEKGVKYIVDGTNLDDTKDYRPGMRALKELDVKSPLLENSINKEEIRILSKELGLETWNKPAYACLLSRIPYNQEIKEEDLSRIEKAEVYMMELGFRAVRVRSHGDLARIEVPQKERTKIFNEINLDNISKKFKELGFKYVTVDAEGYKMGSLNASINKN
ncbi:ATP-dependent sacrificial sulfur transferase LarE [Clostridium sporogenes]|uniref:ATP-dependent sacrificial sulfur transferase LarE n=1 Tax=Clostridium botulinum TaxID=1491 RepID=A0A6M0T0W7_CLOBO|nr:ATP-dependent sacrificial sulfur transferase LarE [Clostridium sporogenes]NFA60442.1 ATP-dependent sacrificial sulfur transferase LarE [Clostridium botulinum]NFI72261.1 ATP-dependent sacrificial sulfur transferase LarE [Clostridium sporogenes]NFL72625.1 ATP-dependent sacrificial sulfur transferase LarE [Clostridium sporogenes]NFM24524.1 ATP-dependent sacrificial sulfur transferase LarE [Clostridium sporogenes]NFP60891.1 ATP-dependent sacrificial sulfur transferase LarE [Clostridium sporogen